MSLPDLHFIGYLLGGSWNMAEVSNYFKKRKAMKTVCKSLSDSFHGPSLLVSCQCRPTDTESHPRKCCLIVMTANSLFQLVIFLQCIVLNA